MFTSTSTTLDDPGELRSLIERCPSSKVHIFLNAKEKLSLSLYNPCFSFYLFSHKNQEIPLGLINRVFKKKKKNFGIFSLYLAMFNVTSECTQNVEKHARSAEKKGKPGFTIQLVPANENAPGTSVKALGAHWGLDPSKVNSLG